MSSEVEVERQAASQSTCGETLLTLRARINDENDQTKERTEKSLLMEKRSASGGNSAMLGEVFSEIMLQSATGTTIAAPMI